MPNRARRLILAGLAALALISSFAATFAQAPGPVPALPDTERRTSYSISASTCACAVGFQLFGDSTDYANWLEVFVNGVRITQAGNWTIASPSGSIATIPRPITDAVLTFSTVQTGTVQIVGARRPRRTSQFQESQPVPTRNFNQVFSDIIATQRELWDKSNDVTGRSAIAPPGETLALLPVLASRANMGACFDSAGNLNSCVSIAGSTITAGNGISFTGANPTTIANNIQAGLGISITGVNPLTITGTAGASVLYVRPQDFGAVCDGTTDDHTALQNMISASAGKTIFIPTGGACVTSVTLTLPSNTTIVGAGWDASIIKINNCSGPVFSTTNTSNIILQNFQLQATITCVTTAVTTFGMIAIIQDGSAAANASNFNFQYLKFANFNGNYWIYANTAGSTFSISNITIANNWILTTASDVPADDVGHHGNSAGIVFFSNSAGNGQYNNTIITNNRLDGGALCFGVILFGNFQKYQIANNLIDQISQTSTAHCNNAGGVTINSYGIAVYDSNNDGFIGRYGLIANNTIYQPYGSGIYIPGVGAAFTNVIGNLIVGQTSQDDVTLPRAAIAINQVTDVQVVGNMLISNYGGINVNGQVSGIVDVHGNHCSTGVGAGVGTPFCVSLTAGVGTTAKIMVRDNYLENSGNVVIRAFSGTTARFAQLEISNNTVTAGVNGLSFANQFVSGQFTVAGNTFQGAATGLSMFNVGSLTGPIAIKSNIFVPTAAPIFANLPTTAINGSDIFISDAAPASSPCTGASTGSNAFRQNGAWKCF